MPEKVDLLIIDGQYDFASPQGSLFVKGADEDMKRVADMVNRIGKKLNDIHATLDSHHYVDVAHPVFWKDSSGKHPDPFTIITAQDVIDGNWSPTQPSLQKRMLDYVKTLEKNGRYPLCIWPPHCLIGTVGQTVVEPLASALLEWEKDFSMVNFLTKGSNIFTEHYSAVVADVPDATDTTTQMNTQFIQTLMETDLIAICGEAGSHCLAHTTRDICTAFGDDSYIKKIVLLEDGTSPVTGFEQMQEDFIKEMKAKGMQISNTKEFLS